MTVGTLLLLFVVYELWGTGLQEAKAQRSLRSQWDATVQSDRTTTTLPPTTSVVPTTPSTGGIDQVSTTLRVVPVSPATADIPLPKYGDPVGVIRIPRIGLTRTIVEGTSSTELARGPGHYPETPLPGQAGNAAIAGHRTTHGQPFHNLDKLQPGDQILVQTRQGRFAYEVQKTTIVGPHDTEVLLPTKDRNGNLEDRITLTACNPKWSASQRIVVTGLLVGKPAAPYTGQVPQRNRLIEHERAGGSRADTIVGGIDGIRPSSLPAVWWGLLCAGIWAATWLAQVAIRRSRAGGRTDAETGGTLAVVAGFGLSPADRVLSWTPYVIGLPVFLLALYVCFEHLALLLPNNF